MRYILTLIISLLPLTLWAQTQKHSIEIYASSFTAVQTDKISGVAIDKIGKDHSNRECARIKMRINRMTAAEIGELAVRPRGGNVEVMKCAVAAEGNGLIIELTAKEPTTFYITHPKYGDSNEVSLNLEGGKEYKLNAELQHLQPIVVESNVAGADVYIDNEYKGQTNENFKITINDLKHGEYMLRVQHGSYETVQKISITSSDIHFKAEIEQARERYYDVAFKLTPEDARLHINGELISMSFGVAQTMLPNGTYRYEVTAEDYFDESGEFSVKDHKFVKSINLKPAYGWLEVIYDDDLSDAVVKVDNKTIDAKDLAKLEVGKHNIEVLKPMYKPHKGEFELMGNDTIPHRVKLERNFANVTIYAGGNADIYINNDLADNSQWTGRLEAGTYRFEARKHNHNSVVMDVEISPEKLNQVYRLQTPTLKCGTLELNGSPEGAKVSVNGEVIGELPLIEEFEIGDFNLYIEKEGYQHSYISVNIEENKTNTKTIELKPIFGEVLIEGTPKAEVLLDGKAIGKIPFTKKVQVGKHNIEVRKEGYITQKRSVEIMINNNTLEFNLQALEVANQEIISENIGIKDITIEDIKIATPPNSMESNVLITYKHNSAQVYVDGIYMGMANRSYKLRHGPHYIVVERNGKRWGQNVNINASTRQVYMYDAKRVTDRNQLILHRSKENRSRNGWNAFNIGFTVDVSGFNSPFYDYVGNGETNSTQLGLGGGLVCRIPPYNSYFVPTFGFRYMYAFEVMGYPYQPAVTSMSIPIIFNINWTGDLFSGTIYSGIGVEPTYYMIKDDNYTANYWGFPFAFNIIGLGTRHFNLDIYLNYSRKAKHASVLGLRMSLII